MPRERTEGTAALKADRRYTYGDYRTWPEDERWELIDGVAYAMSPTPRREHQGIVVAIAGRIKGFIGDGQCRVYTSPIDVFFPEGEAAPQADAEWADTAQPDETIDDVEVVLQPDIVVVCDRDKLIDEGILGAPDLVFEILSPATAMRDQTEKRDIYERHGVREYWVVNPRTFEVFIYTQDTQTGGGFGLPKPATLTEPTPVGILPGLAISVRRDEL